MWFNVFILTLYITTTMNASKTRKIYESSCNNVCLFVYFFCVGGLLFCLVFAIHWISFVLWNSNEKTVIFLCHVLCERYILDLYPFSFYWFSLLFITEFHDVCHLKEFLFYWLLFFQILLALWVLGLAFFLTEFRLKSSLYDR